MEDSDVTVRTQALDIIGSLVNKDNLMDIVQRLMSHVLVHEGPNDSLQDLPSFVSDPEYRVKVAKKILEISQKDMYDHVEDFEWLLSVLPELSRVQGLDLGNLLSDMLMDICVRIPGLRSYAVNLLVSYDF